MRQEDEASSGLGNQKELKHVLEKDEMLGQEEEQLEKSQNIFENMAVQYEDQHNPTRHWFGIGLGTQRNDPFCTFSCAMLQRSEDIEAVCALESLKMQSTGETCNMALWVVWFLRTCTVKLSIERSFYINKKLYRIRKDETGLYG